MTTGSACLVTAMNRRQQHSFGGSFAYDSVVGGAPAPPRGRRPPRDHCPSLLNLLMFYRKVRSSKPEYTVCLLHFSGSVEIMLASQHVAYKQLSLIQVPRGVL